MMDIINGGLCMKKSIANGDDPAEIFGALQEYAEANK